MTNICLIHCIYTKQEEKAGLHLENEARGGKSVVLTNKRGGRPHPGAHVHPVLYMYIQRSIFDKLFARSSPHVICVCMQREVNKQYYC